MPDGAAGGSARAGNARFGVRHAITSTNATATAIDARPSTAPARQASALTEAVRQAARQPIGATPASAQARHVVDSILNGLRPSAATLLAALDMPAPASVADEKSTPASPPPATQIARALTSSVARVDAARHAKTGSLVTPTAFVPSRPDPSPPPTPAASGFRRLAALFAQPTSGMPEASPAFAAGPEAGAISRRQPAPVFSQATVREAAPARSFVLRHVSEDVAAEAEVAELLTRVLRREARRQGIADEGGAA